MRYLQIKKNAKTLNLRDVRHSTRNIQIHIVDFFQNLSYLATYVYAKRYRYTQTHTQRETGVMTIGKICEADLPKTFAKNRGIFYPF